MSDEGDYDDAYGDDLEAEAEIGLADAEVEADADGDAETDAEADADAEAEIDADADEQGSAEEGAHEVPRAGPQPPRVDPLLHRSNTAGVIRVVPRDEYVTSNCVQLAEAAGLIAKRAEAIAAGGPSFEVRVEGAPPLRDAGAKAFKEFYDRRSPLTIRRVVGVGPAGETLVEDWNPREMTLPAIPLPAALAGGRGYEGGRAGGGVRGRGW